MSKNFPSNARILVESYRGDFIESRHRGWIAICDNKGNIKKQLGKPLPSVYVRSSLKPFQLLPLIINKIDKKFNFTEQELAIIMSSHSGQDKHIELVCSVLEKISLTKENLKCGAHPPIHKASASAIYKKGEKPCTLHCNCSGKHSGMLAICKFYGWDIKGYLYPAHSVQKLIKESIAYMSDVPEEELKAGIDGCGVPVYTIPLNNLAMAYARLVAPENLKKEYQQAVKKVIGIMIKYPDLIAGDERFDTDLMKEMNGQLICKGGGEAVCCTGILNQGLGVAIKIEDGNSRAVGPVMLETLKQLNVINKSELENLKKWHYTPSYNFAKTLVGELNPVFRL